MGSEEEVSPVSPALTYGLPEAPDSPSVLWSRLRMSVGEPYLSVFVFMRGAEFIDSEKFSLGGAVSPLLVAFPLTFRGGMSVPVCACGALGRSSPGS